jgi:hypothetical protein
MSEPKVCNDHYDCAACCEYQDAAIATATAGALEQACDLIAKYGLKFEHDKCTGEGCVYCELNRLVSQVHSLIPADIAAKAKEHDAKIRREALSKFQSKAEFQVNYWLNQGQSTLNAVRIGMDEAARILLTEWANEADGGER